MTYVTPGTSQPSISERRPWSTAVTVTLILLVAAAARFVELFRHSTIPDEAFTIWLSAHPLAQMLSILRTGDFHPPLSYLIAHALLALTPKAYLFRAITAACGVLGVGATYFLAVRIIGRLAWLPALLTAVTPSLVYFDRFFRMYAILAALTALSWLLLVRSLEKPERPWRWVAYAVVAALLIYTHYLAFFTLAAQAVCVAVAQPRQWRYWLSLAAAVVAWLPWLPAFLEQLPNGGTAFNGVTAFQFRYTLPAFVLTDGLPDALEFNSAYLALLWALLAAGVIVSVLRPKYRLAAWLLVPIALQALYTFAAGRNLLTQRYLLDDVFALNIAVCVPVSALAAGRWRSAGAAMAAALILLMTNGTIDKLFISKFMAVDWQAYARFLGGRAQHGDVIVFDDASAWLALADNPLVRRYPTFPVSNQKAARAVANFIARYPRVWYVDYQSQFSDPNHLIFDALRRTHPVTRTWVSTEEGHLDVVTTTLFAEPTGKLTAPERLRARRSGPKRAM